MKQSLVILTVLVASGLLFVQLASDAAQRPAAEGPLSSALVLMAPELSSLVDLSYIGLAGSCAGRSFEQDPISIPAGAAVRIAPGPKGEGLLPADCLAAARIRATRGAVVAQASLEDERGAGDAPAPVAAYIAPAVQRSVTEVLAPRFGRGLDEGDSLLVALNGGTDKTEMVLTLVDAQGNIVPPTRCPECSRVVEAGGAALWSAAEMAALLPGQPFAARLSADQPLAAALVQMSAELKDPTHLDPSAYAAVPVGGEPGDLDFLPQALVAEPSRPDFQTWLTLQNASPQALAQAALSFRRTGQNPVAQQLGPLAPGAAGQLFLSEITALSPGTWNVAVSADQGLASAVFVRRAGRSGESAYTAPELSTDALLPHFVMADGLLSILNTDPQSRAPVNLQALALGKAEAVFSANFVIPPGGAEHLAMKALAPNGELPPGFEGSLRIRSTAPLAVAALLPSAGDSAVSAVEAAAAGAAAADLVAPLIFSAWAPGQEPPTPTATGTPRETETATATPQVSDTPSPTRPADQTPTPTPTASATRPTQPGASPTPPATRPAKERQWTRHSSANSALPGDSMHYVEVDTEGGVWVRVKQDGRMPDKVVRILSGRPWQVFEGQRRAVEANLALIRGQGTLRDFWAVDEEPPPPQRRVWVGPSFYDGARWTDVAQDETQPGGGSLRHELRALLDPLGQAAVPFEVTLDCQTVLPCVEDGLRAYAADGRIGYDLRFVPSTDAGEFGLEAVHLLASGRTGAVAAGLAAADARERGMGTQSLPVAAAPAQAGQAYAVSQAALYVLPGPEPIDYPYLGSDAELRNAGYASAAALAPDGRLVVVTWVERHALPPARAVTYHVYANTWTGSGWLTEDLTASPLFNGDARYDRITAAAFCAATDGALWLTTHSGAVAARHSDLTWEVAAPPGEAQFAGIVDAACDGAGTLWMATENGLLQGALGIPFAVYAPFTYKP